MNEPEDKKETSDEKELGSTGLKITIDSNDPNNYSLLGLDGSSGGMQFLE